MEHFAHYLAQGLDHAPHDLSFHQGWAEHDAHIVNGGVLNKFNGSRLGVHLNLADMATIWKID